MKFKRVKSSLFLFFICSAAFLSPVSASAEVLFGKDYQQTLNKYLNQSKSSITVAMYFIITGPEDKAGPVNELVNSLVAAKNRGVEVKVILEDLKPNENRLAYQKLKANNIPVYFDTPQNLLHLKAVVIDDRYVFLGSANWSKAAMEDNYEATYFNDSTKDARVLKKYINNIPIQKKDLFLPQKEGVFISSSFLTSPKLGRRLLKAQAFKQFDLYLLLCKLQQEASQSPLEIDYNLLAQKMGYTIPKDLGKYRNPSHYFYERIHHSLKRLKRYGLINYDKGKVTLKSGPKSESGAQSIIIPFKYWDDNGYSDTLSMRAKYIYLICLYEAGRSAKYPFWFRSQKDMSKLYGISDTTISLGLLELEAKGKIEVIRDKPTPPDFSSRKANTYRNK